MKLFIKILWVIFIVIAVITVLYSFKIWLNQIWNPEEERLNEKVRKNVYRTIDKIEWKCREIEDFNNLFKICKPEVYTLHFIGKPAAKIYLQYFKEKNRDWKLRFIMAQLLAEMKYDQSLDQFVTTLSNESEEMNIRVIACISLGELDNSLATKSLIEVMNNTVGVLQLAAINSLGEIRDTESLSALRSRLDIEEIKDVREEIEKALAKKNEPKKRRGPWWPGAQGK